MAKRRRPTAKEGSAPAKPAARWPRSDIKHTSVYLPEAAYEALRQVAFDERCKIHDLLMEGVELALKRRIPRACRREGKVAAQGTLRLFPAVAGKLAVQRSHSEQTVG
jgi:hypothetical protein